MSLRGWLFVVFGLILAPSLWGQETAKQAPDGALPAGAILRMGSTRLQHQYLVTSVAFSPDGKHLASADHDSVRVWEVATGLKTWQTALDPCNTLAFSPDGKLLASGGHINCLKLWDLAAQTVLFTLKGHRDGISSVAFSRDGKFLASAGRFYDRTVKLWHVPTGKEQVTLRGHLHGVNQVAFTPDDQVLVTCSDDKTIILWDVAHAVEIATLKGHDNAVPSLAISPDGKTLATIGVWERCIKLWDAAPEPNSDDLP